MYAIIGNLIAKVIPFRWIIAGVASLLTMLGIYFLGYSDGKQHVQVLWDADKTAIAQAAAIQANKTASQIKAAQHTTEDIANEYEHKISELRAYYAGLASDSVRNDTATDSCSMPAVSNSAQGANEGAANKGSSKAIEAKCAETTQQLISLQDWINSQKKINP